MRFCVAPSRRGVMIGLIMAAHAGMLLYAAATNFPTTDEQGHLPAGLAVWRFGRFDVYPVNPPLVKTVAAVPVLAMNPAMNLHALTFPRERRFEGEVASGFRAANARSWHRYFVAARWAVVPFSLLGAWCCCRWATELFGPRSGVAALLLWCADPHMLAWGSTITAECAAAALAILAAYTFWRWLKRPAWSTAAVAGAALGGAQLCKFTLLVLFPVWGAVWLMARVFRLRYPARDAFGPPPLSQLVLVFFLAVDVINLGYLGQGSFERLGNYDFNSRALAGARAANQAAQGNRFAGTWMATLRVPLPRDYLRGIDLQKVDFETWGARRAAPNCPAPLGFSFYLAALATRWPLGTLALVAVACCAALRRFKACLGRSWLRRDARVEPRFHSCWTGSRWRLGLAPAVRRALPTRNAGQGRYHSATALALLALTAVAVLGLVSANPEVAYLRYALPMFPFVFVLLGQLFARRNLLGWFCLAAAVVSSLAWSPHHLGYFNESSRLNDWPQRHFARDLDWQQDTWRLVQWSGDHPRARPLFVAGIAPVPPFPPSPGSAQPSSWIPVAGQPMEPGGANSGATVRQPGWYAISLHERHGCGSGYDDLFVLGRIIDRAGSTIWILRVGRDERYDVPSRGFAE